MLKSPWNYSSIVLDGLAALHCVSLACACLAVGEYGSIVALEHTFNNGQCSMIKNTLLLAIWLECHIEAEYPFLFTNLLSVGYENLPSLGFDVNDGFVARLYFAL